MHRSSYDALSYRSGDLAGLRFLHDGGPSVPSNDLFASPYVLTGDAADDGQRHDHRGRSRTERTAARRRGRRCVGVALVDRGGRATRSRSRSCRARSTPCSACTAARRSPGSPRWPPTTTGRPAHRSARPASTPPPGTPTASRSTARGGERGRFTIRVRPWVAGPFSSDVAFAERQYRGLPRRRPSDPHRAADHGGEPPVGRTDRRRRDRVAGATRRAAGEPRPGHPPLPRVLPAHPRHRRAPVLDRPPSARLHAVERLVDLRDVERVRRGLRRSRRRGVRRAGLRERAGARTGRERRAVLGRPAPRRPHPRLADDAVQRVLRARAGDGRRGRRGVAPPRDAAGRSVVRRSSTPTSASSRTATRSSRSPTASSPATPTPPASASSHDPPPGASQRAPGSRSSRSWADAKNGCVISQRKRQAATTGATTAQAASTDPGRGRDAGALEGTVHRLGERPGREQLGHRFEPAELVERHDHAADEEQHEVEAVGRGQGGERRAACRP